jgi:hypothetical protein
MLGILLDKSLETCKNNLQKSNFSHLTGLLDKTKEMELFREIKEYALRKNKNKRIPYPTLFKKYRIKVSVFPPLNLPIVCVCSKDGVKTTPIGQVIRAVYQCLDKKGIEGYLLLTSGGAKEVVRIKPKAKSRISKAINLKMDYLDPLKETSFVDGDFILMVSNSSITEMAIADGIEDKLAASTLQIKVIDSKSRPFSRIDIGRQTDNKVFDENHWSLSWRSQGHITFPEFLGNYSSSIPFVLNLMSFNDSYPCILLIPTSKEFIGAYIDFFPCQKSYKEIIYNRPCQDCINQCFTLKPTVFNWPEIAFPFKESPPEALAHFTHLLKSCTWDDQLPLIKDEENGEKLRVLLEKRFRKRSEKIKNIARKTSLYFAHKIIYPIAVNTNLIAGNPVTMRKSTERLLKTIKPMLNGNPYLGLIYLLSAGENPTDAPVYGTGIIDPKGFFPELYEFLHQKDRLDRSIKLMAKTEEGPVLKGWPVFLNFIYRETGFDLRETAKLLNPNFCSLEVYPTLVKDFISPDLGNFSAPSRSIGVNPSIST